MWETTKCIVWETNGRVWAKAVKPLHGQLEVRGIGIVRVPAVRRARVNLLVDLIPQSSRLPRLSRLPKPKTEKLCGVAVPRWRLAPFEASALDKLRLLVQRL